MQSQKQAVIDLVKRAIPGFVSFKDIALVMLSGAQLEAIKQQVTEDILMGNIEYSKDKSARAEVATYARSMVMNHLKKAKELNGNQVYTTNPAAAKVRKEEKALSGVNLDILPGELKEFVKTLT